MAATLPGELAMSDMPLQRRRRLLLAALGAPLLLRAPFSFAAECKTAASSILGPAYRPDAPFRSALCPASEPGTRLAMSGAVRAQDSCKPLAGAVLDVWQANAAGEYDWDSPRYHLRGRLRAGADGAYEFTSIVPGQYGSRARHIHFLVTAPGHEPRITQCYFADDEQAKKDRLVKPSQVITLEKAGSGRRGRFDFALDPERKADAASVSKYPEYVGEYELQPGVFLAIALDGARLRWNLSAPEMPGDPLTGLFYPRSTTRFYCAEYDLMVAFVRDDAGRVKGLLTNDRDLAAKVA